MQIEDRYNWEIYLCPEFRIGITIALSLYRSFTVAKFVPSNFKFLCKGEIQLRNLLVP